MRNAIVLNASFFNTHRMVMQYLYDAYRPTREIEAEDDELTRELLAQREAGAAGSDRAS